MFPSVKLFGLVAAVILVGCVSVPTGPSVMVLPGTGKNFDQFRVDEGVCRQYAYEQIGGQTATRSQTDAAVKSAVVGTAVGALAGVAIGGHSQDAAVGAGVGLLSGSLIGSSSGNLSAYDAQHRYDIAYIQCMYAKGHRVPVSRSYLAPGYSAPPAYSPPPPATQQRPDYTTPPPGAPPPPPPSG